jgi:hypothetical protein
MHPPHMLTHLVKTRIRVIARLYHALELRDLIPLVYGALVATELSRALERCSAAGDIAIVDWRVPSAWMECPNDGRLCSGQWGLWGKLSQALHAGVAH